MKYGTICSGIEAPSVAWKHLNWEPVWFAENDPFPKQVLQKHYPNVPDLGDITKVKWDEQANVDVLIGGTPCQSFSVAGLRNGMDDPRGNLALQFLRIVDATQPKWVIWENVPGVLSSNKGRDFGAFIGGLVELGLGYAYRTLDAQYFGVPQRRKRVFVVACPGNWTRPASVLFDSKSLQRSPKKSKSKEKKVAALTANGVGTCGADDNQAQAGHLIAFHPRQDPISSEITMPCETKGPMAVNYNDIVRRLTPAECEKLQGFQKNYTRIQWRNKSEEECPDGHRYKALGNSMAVPVVKWLGERIDIIENLPL